MFNTPELFQRSPLDKPVGEVGKLDIFIFPLPFILNISISGFIEEPAAPAGETFQ